MTTDSFREYVLDQLSDLGGLRCRAMFGGHGVYRRDVFFAILYQGRLYFKTDATTRGPYVECGMSPFQPVPEMMLKNYYEVPPEVIEDANTLVVWAHRALTAQTGATLLQERKKNRKTKSKKK